MSDDLVLNVKQIAQYPWASSVTPRDVFLIQRDVSGGGPLGGPYASVDGPTFLRTVLANGGWLQMAPGPLGGIAFNGAALELVDGWFTFTEPVRAPIVEAAEMFVAGLPVADRNYVDQLFESIVNNSVLSVNGRSGHVQLEREDILRAGAAPIWDAHFGGHITAPTSWNVFANDDTVATVQWVQQWACHSGLVVSSLNGRGGAVTLNADDVTIALTTVPGTYGEANTPPLGDMSRRIANTLFVDNAIEDLRAWTIGEFETYNQIMALNFAPLTSPNFIGVPTAPTANPGNNTGQIATTAFVQAAVTASTTGVASFNGRTGAVVLDSADLVTAGAATLNSPAFTGTPSAPTAAPGTNNTQLATTAFVEAAVSGVNAGVTTFNGRTGAVALTIADITGVGGAPIASPALSGAPTAPTPGPTSNSTAIATTAFVQGLLSSLPSAVSSFNGRTGAVSLIGADVSAAGGALTASPNFTGVPTAPTAIAGTSTQQLATTAFVQNALTSAVAGVSTWNGRSGAVTMTAADVTNVGGALLASPTFTGTPAAPTATAGTNSTQIATTAYVTAAIAAINGVTTFNTRTGAITLNSGDVSAAGGALINSPTFTGTPAAPTAGPGTATTQIATTAFVTNALAATGGVSSFNGRAGAITLTAADLTSAGGALLAGPAFTGVPTAPTAAPGTNTTQLATCAFVAAAIAGFAPLASPAFTGVPTAPTPVTTDSSTAIATTAFVKASQGAAASGSLVLINKQTVSSPVLSVAFTNVFNATYSKYVLRFTSITVTGNGAQIYAQFSSNGGSSWIGGSLNNTALFFVLNNNSGNYGGSANGTYLVLSLATDATAGYSMSGEYMIYNTRIGTLNKVIKGDCVTIASSGLARSIVANVLAQQAVVDSIQLSLSTGQFAAGTIELFGVVT